MRKKMETGAVPGSHLVCMERWDYFSLAEPGSAQHFEFTTKQSEISEVKAHILTSFTIIPGLGKLPQFGVRSSELRGQRKVKPTLSFD